MTHPLLICLILTIHLITSQVVYSEPLSLQAYIQGALAHHPSANLDQLEWVQKLHALEASNRIKEWTLFAETSYEKGLSGWGSSFSKEGNRQYASIGVDKKIIATGAQINLSTSRRSVRNQAQLESFPISNQHESAIQLKFTQPLLKNIWGKVDRYPLQIKDIQSKLAYLKYNTDLDVFVRRRINQYLDWLYYYQAWQLREKQYQKAIDQIKILDRQYNQSATELNDLVLAKQNALAKKMIMNEAKLTYKRQWHDIRIPLNDNLGSKKEWVPDIKTVLQAPSKDMFTYIKTKSILSKIMALNLSMDRLTVDLKRHEQRPNINISAILSGKNLSSSSESLWDDQFGNHQTNLALSIHYPLGNNQAKSEYNVAVVSEKMRLKQQENQWNDIKVMVNNIEEEINVIRSQIEDLNELIALSKKLADLEKEKYFQGRSQSLTFVINAENSVLDTHIQKLQLMRDLNKRYNEQQMLLNRYSRQYGKKEQ